MDTMSPTAQALIEADRAREAAMSAAYHAEGTDREDELDAAYEEAEAAYRAAAKAHRDARIANGDNTQNLAPVAPKAMAKTEPTPRTYIGGYGLRLQAGDDVFINAPGGVFHMMRVRIAAIQRSDDVARVYGIDATGQMNGDYACPIEWDKLIPVSLAEHFTNNGDSDPKMNDKAHKNLVKSFNGGKVHAPNGDGTQPICMPYGGNGSHGVWTETSEEVTCKRCDASTTDQPASCPDAQCVIPEGHFPAEYHRDAEGNEWGDAPIRRRKKNYPRTQVERGQMRQWNGLNIPAFTVGIRVYAKKYRVHYTSGKEALLDAEEIFNETHTID